MSIQTDKSQVEQLMDELVESSKVVDTAWRGMEEAFVKHSEVLQAVYESLKMFVEAGDEVVNMADIETVVGTEEEIEG